MKTFLAIYTGTAASMSRWEALTEAQREERMAQGISAWNAWLEQHKALIVDKGGPLGRTKQMTSAGVADIRNNMSAYCLVQAESHEQAVRLFENHPHFTIFPGDGVEVMECLPIPTQSA